MALEIAYGVLALIALGLAWKGFLDEPLRGGCLFGSVAMLISLWGLSNAIQMLAPYPVYALPFIAMDLTAGSIIAYSYLRRREWWKPVLAGLFLLQLGWHIAFWAHRDKVAGLEYTFALGLNTVAWAQLMVVTVPGAWHVMGLVGRAASLSDLFHSPAARHQGRGP